MPPTPDSSSPAPEKKKTQIRDLPDQTLSDAEAGDTVGGAGPIPCVRTIQPCIKTMIPCLKPGTR